MATATAEIRFEGGSLVVPAGTPYERQQLIEHVHGCVRSRVQVRVRVDQATWLVEPPGFQRPVCGACARRIKLAVCRRCAKSGMLHCVVCALARPHLTVSFLSQLPGDTVLRDVQAHYAYGGDWIAWTRWAQATPAEIIDDIHLQRRFAPVLTWRCAEICVPQASHTFRQVRRPAVRLARLRYAKTG